MMPHLDIYCGDAAHKLVNVRTESIPLVVTSPPYDDARKGAYAGLDWQTFTEIARELYRVLVAGGIVCWNVNDMVVNGSETLTSCKQKIFFVEECGFRCHDTMIYEKTNFSHPETSRYHNTFEYVFVLSKGAPRCFNPIKDKKNAYGGKLGSLGRNTFTKRNGTKGIRNTQHNIVAEFGMRTNVWRGNTRGQEDPCGVKLKHPAMMPKWLARDLILSFSNPGDTVLDPMGGSGTTAMMALQNGRHAILIDRNPDYTALARESCCITPGLQLA
jgi:DNA modification methylase